MASLGASKAGIPVRDDPMAIVAWFSSRQHGSVARRQLVAAGFPRSTIDDWVKAGRFLRLHRGVYSAIPLALLTVESRWMAAVLACGDESVLSHGPAAQLGGIVSRGERFAVHISKPGRTRLTIPGVVVHRPRGLERRDVTRRLWIPSTTTTRTIWDLSTDWSGKRFRRAFEQAEKQGDLDRVRLGELLDAAPSRRGSGNVRELLGRRSVPLSRARTRLEEILLEICSDHDLPFPAVNVPMLGYEIDFVWEGAKLIVEADGGDHLNREQRDKDNARDAHLARHGWLVRRYSWWALQQEASVAAEVLSILREQLPR